MSKGFVPLLVLLVLSSACALFSQAISKTRLLELFELRTMDYRVAARKRSLQPSPDIAIVALDDESFKHIPQPFALWQPLMARVAGYLVQNGAKVVGIDVLQDRPLEKFIPGQTKRMLYLLLSGKIILISYMYPDGSMVYPYDTLRAAAGLDQIGLSDFTPDPDQVMRREAIFQTDGRGENHLSFPFLVASRFLGERIKTRENSGYTLGNRRIPSREGYVFINYAGGAGTFQPFSFFTLLSKAEAGDAKYFSDNFRGKTVLIGRTDTLGNDFAYTPFNVESEKLMSGIEVDANVVNTLLQREYFSFMSRRARWLSLWLLTAFVALACYFLRPLAATLASAGILAGYLWLGFYLFARFDYVSSFAPLCASVPLAYGATFVYRYFTVDLRVRRVRKVFAKMVSRSVEEKLWREDIDPLPGQAAEKKATVLFADINGFSTKCDQNPAGQIMTWLNAFYQEMVDVAHRNRGTVKQFVGDEIMVLFGAPSEEPDQAFLAVKTAVEMVETLARRKVEDAAFGFDSVKIGIHTGMTVVGFVGSSARVEYSVIGSGVNLAARLEQLNTRLGTGILISEESYFEMTSRHAGDLNSLLGGVEFRHWPPQELKGFERKIGVVEVLMHERRMA